MGQQLHNLMTVKETAEYLRIPLPTVYYLVQRGQLPVKDALADAVVGDAIVCLAERGEYPDDIGDP